MVSPARNRFQREETLCSFLGRFAVDASRNWVVSLLSLIMEDVNKKLIAFSSVTMNEAEARLSYDGSRR